MLPFEENILKYSSRNVIALSVLACSHENVIKHIFIYVLTYKKLVGSILTQPEIICYCDRLCASIV